MPFYRNLLGKLYKITGKLTRNPSNRDYRTISKAFHDSDPEVRQRAVFAGGLRWKDRTMLGYIFYALHSGTETHEYNRCFMISTLASAAVSGDLEVGAVDRELLRVLESESHTSMEAKTAFISLLEVRGLISVAELARTDYEEVLVDMSRLAH